MWASCLSDTSAHVLLFLVQPLRLQRRKVQPDSEEDSDQPEDSSCCEEPWPDHMAIRLRVPPLAYVARLHADADDQQHRRDGEADPVLQ